MVPYPQAILKLHRPSSLDYRVRHELSVIRSLFFNHVSAAYHPSANTVVAGSLDGFAVVLNAETGVHITTVRICSAPLNDLKFNRSGSQFACAAQTGIVHIYR